MDAYSLYRTFMAGWRAGAGAKAMDPDRTAHADQSIRDAYNEGYKLGQANAREASVTAGLQYKCRPTILRCSEPVELT